MSFVIVWLCDRNVCPMFMGEKNCATKKDLAKWKINYETFTHTHTLLSAVHRCTFTMYMFILLHQIPSPCNNFFLFSRSVGLTTARQSLVCCIAEWMTILIKFHRMQLRITFFFTLNMIKSWLKQSEVNSIRILISSQVHMGKKARCNK